VIANSPWPRRTSSAAYASALLSLLAFGLLGVRVALGPPVSDPTHPSRLVVESLDALGAASVAPVAYAFHQLYTRFAPTLGILAMGLGITASGVQTALDFLFLLGVLQFGAGAWVTIAVFGGLALQGAWLILAGNTAEKNGRFPRGTLVGVVGAIVYPLGAIWIAWRASHPIGATR
jgi:hypothetical protein